MIKTEQQKLFNVWVCTMVEKHKNGKTTVEDVAYQAYRMGYADSIINLGGSMAAIVNEEFSKDRLYDAQLAWIPLKKE